MKLNTFKRKLTKYITNPRNLYIRRAMKSLYKNNPTLDDETFLKAAYKIVFGKGLNLDDPKTFNEKLQWLKLYNREPIYTTMVDKHSVKKFVADRIGEQYVIREYGAYPSYDKIDFNSLPDRFVLKTTHGCGGMAIVKDKSTINHEKLSGMFQKGLADNYYMHCREWPYKNVAPQIIAEEFMVDEGNDVLPVYKFFCFDGKPFIAQVIQNDKQENEVIDYIDMDYNLLKLKQNYPNSKKLLPRPSCFEEMKTICERLTKGIPFVRCDLYAINGKVYFSEFTFFSDAGLTPFHPKKWDTILGDMINLPRNSTN